MVIDVRPSTSIDAGRYLTNRDTQAFTLIEGSSSRFDYLSEKLLKDNPKKKNSHYSFILSFKEEHLNKDKLFKYYEEFKKMMFKNYHSSELEILSVAHWDDNKPHIHCLVLNGSQIDKDKDLQIYRGTVDFTRNTSISEIINYKHGLASPLDNLNLLSLSKEQKLRDWKMKKRGKKHYQVFDDLFHADVERLLKSNEVNNFNDFIEKIEDNYGEAIINTSDKTKAKLLKDFELVLTNKNLDSGGNYTYKSVLFNEKWFNKNILKLKTTLKKVDLKDIVYSKNRKSLKEYERLYKETSKKHLEHITKRKIGKDYISKSKDIVLENSLKNILASTSRNDTEAVEISIERFLHNANTKYILEFIKKYDIDSISYTKDSVVLNKKGKSYEIYNEKLNKILRNKMHNNKEFNSLLLGDGNYTEKIKELLKNISSNRNKAEARLLLEESFYEKRIKNRKELQSFLKELNLKLLKTSYDIKRGGYITLESKKGVKFSVYNDAMAGISNISSDNSLYKEIRNKEIDKDLNNNFITNYVKSVYIDLYSSESRKPINSVYDYRLEKSDSLLDQYFKIYNSNTKGEKIDKFIYNNKSKIANEQIDILNDGSIRVVKSLDRFQTGINLADLYMINGKKDISIDIFLDGDLKDGFIHRIKEKNYDIRLWDKEGVLIHDGTAVEKEYMIDEKEDIESLELKVDETYKEATNRINKDGGVISILEQVEELKNLDIRTKKGVDNFRRLMNEIGKKNLNTIDAVCSTLDIEPLKTGKDSRKGEYATFKYKDKKIAVYDKKIAMNTSSMIDTSKKVIF